MKKPTLSIIIPVYNEKATIAEAITRVFDLEISKEVIVVDDCSTDGTTEIIKKLQSKCNFIYLHNKENRGKGFSVTVGAKSAKGEYMIVEDSDLELNCNNILEMLSLLQAEKLDMVNGNRDVYNSDKVNKISKLAKFVTKSLLLLLYGQKLNDMLSSYKLCRLEAFRNLELKSERFGLETEWIIKALKNNWKIKEMKIDYYPRKVKEGKKINMWDGVDIVWNIVKYRFVN